MTGTVGTIMTAKDSKGPYYPKPGTRCTKNYGTYKIQVSGLKRLYPEDGDRGNLSINISDMLETGSPRGSNWKRPYTSENDKARSKEFCDSYKDSMENGGEQIIWEGYFGRTASKDNDGMKLPTFMFIPRTHDTAQVGIQFNSEVDGGKEQSTNAECIVGELHLSPEDRAAITELGDDFDLEIDMCNVDVGSEARQNGLRDYFDPSRTIREMHFNKVCLVQPEHGNSCGFHSDADLHESRSFPPSFSYDKEWEGEVEFLVPIPTGTGTASQS